MCSSDLVQSARLPGGCEQCRGTGYRGRTVLAEFLIPEGADIARAILARSDVRHLEQLAVEAGMIDRWGRACAAVEAGLTSPEEVRRVLGVGSPKPADRRAEEVHVPEPD